MGDGKGRGSMTTRDLKMGRISQGKKRRKTTVSVVRKSIASGRSGNGSSSRSVRQGMNFFSIIKVLCSLGL